MRKTDRLLYVLEAVISSGEHLSLETIGVYSSESEAKKAIQGLPPESKRVAYNIQSFIVDASPLGAFYGFPKDIKELMDLGVIDQLVGEDGNFYYTLTDFGKEITKHPPNETDEG